MDSENCPAGFEYLLHVDRLFVKQETEIMEAFTGIETANKYQVRIDPCKKGPSRMSPTGTTDGPS